MRVRVEAGSCVVLDMAMGRLGGPALVPSCCGNICSCRKSGISWLFRRPCLSPRNRHLQSNPGNGDVSGGGGGMALTASSPGMSRRYPSLQAAMVSSMDRRVLDLWLAIYTHIYRYYMYVLMLLVLSWLTHGYKEMLGLCVISLLSTNSQAHPAVVSDSKNGGEYAFRVSVQASISLSRRRSLLHVVLDAKPSAAHGHRASPGSCAGRS